MGRFSSSLTYTLSTVLVLLLVSFGYSALKKYRLDGSSDETAVNLARAIYTSGLADSLIDSAHPAFLRQVSPAALQSTVSATLARLGPLTAMTEIRGAAQVPMLTYPTQEVTASYEINLLFGESQATLFIDLITQPGGWQVTAFRLDSPLIYN
ncbi:MAG: hypothetical protein ACPG2Q_03920 [Pseudohongiellaceae bacterium]